MLIFGCSLRDELMSRAWSGDPTARDAIGRMLPAVIPARERTRLRDGRIRDIAARLRADQVKMSERSFARMLAQAGTRLRSPRGSLPAQKPFDLLSAEERHLLADDVRAILSWSEDMRWPDKSQMRKILNGVSG